MGIYYVTYNKKQCIINLGNSRLHIITFRYSFILLSNFQMGKESSKELNLVHLIVRREYKDFRNHFINANFNI